MERESRTPRSIESKTAKARTAIITVVDLFAASVFTSDRGLGCFDILGDHVREQRIHRRDDSCRFVSEENTDSCAS